ncbi:HAMP domain-containing histidine kinase [Enterococcus raffinosus]|uniref:HAMP domain-containing sensor histidine kinase n=1 Tax=Enterococcus raffinosus TaxID=71452 RepID=UPI001C11E702|nr:HAMP domain-containing sensor histidine kinase [Enterococcus raffinosus]MBU5363707.1 HAMP domain-containing histidine kinase [Enterococcus raffinosus]
MDWLDDVIARLFAKRSSLDQSLLLYLLIGVLGVAFATLITVSICVSWERLILMPDSEPTFFWDYLSWKPSTTSSPTIQLLEYVRQYSVFVYGFLGVYFATKMFYRKRILQPITILEKSIQQIEQGNYQHPVYYNTYDEFEKTSLGLDHLRLTLQENEKKLNEMYRDQKKVNAAFSHDLRTPLATIQNNLELLEAYYEQDRLSPEVFDKSAVKIKNSITRLSSFSETMQQLQKLEDRPLHKELQPLNLIEEHIREIEQHCSKKELLITKDYPKITAKYDLDLINEVVENLLNNAYRFAKQTIDITITLQEKLVIVYVKDDGPGFSKKELLTATEPYYSQNKNSHFGLGLTIAEALSQKHGGQLKIANSLEGGAIVSAVFLLD